MPASDITGMAEISEREQVQIARANASGKTPVVFVHGLWLLPSSWDNRVALFEENGYVGVTPSWPDDPESIEQARARPEAFARKTLKRVTDHIATVVGQLDEKPAVMGHSTGGIITQMIADRGLSAVSVAIDPGPFRGVLPLPLSTLKASAPVLRNINPFTEAKVDPRNPARGPLLIIEGEKDHTVPWAVAYSAYKRQKHDPSVTEIVRIPNRGTRSRSTVAGVRWRTPHSTSSSGSPSEQPISCCVSSVSALCQPDRPYRGRSIDLPRQVIAHRTGCRHLVARTFTYRGRRSDRVCADGRNRGRGARGADRRGRGSRRAEGAERARGQRCREGPWATCRTCCGSAVRLRPARRR